MLEVRLLGSPIFELDGEQVAADTRKASALLAYVAVEGATRRDTLAALLWPESGESQARATLRRTLSALRSAMGSEVVQTDRQQVLVGPAVSTDVDQFNEWIEASGGHGHDPSDVCQHCIPHLREATELYRGDFLEGFSLRDAPEFDDWLRTTGESYRLACEKAFERLSTAYAAAGDFRSAIAAVNSWLQLDPLREPAYRHLMLLHAWSGDRARATEAYRRCVATLDRELGVKPLEETTELHEAILEEDLPPAPGVRHRPTVSGETGPIRPPDLLDRDDELQTLQEIAADRAGGRVLRLVGDPWMGKTRLLEELTSMASRLGRAVVTARGYRTEQQLPYGVVSQLITALAALDDWPEIKESIPAWALNEAGRLQPDLGSPPATDGGDTFGETRLFDALLTLLASAPFLIIIDDAQWLDTTSAAFVAYFVHRIESLQPLLVVAHRPDDTAELATLIEAASHAPHQDLILSPLNAGQLEEVDTERATEVVRRTGGIPALVVEALAEPDSDEIPGVRRFMDARLAELDQLARQVLAAAAVLSGMCTVERIRETSGRSEEEVMVAVEELLAKQVLVADQSGGLGFALDHMERLVYSNTNLVRRRLLHGRTATALEGSPRSDRDPALVMAVARHHREAGNEAVAADRYALAGDLAREVFAADEAIEAYRAALALGHREVYRLHMTLGEALLFQGLLTDAHAEFEKAAAISEGSERALADHRVGEALRRLGRVESAIEHFQMSQTGHPDPVSLHCDWALALLRDGRQKEAREQADRAVVASTKQDSKSRSRALAVLGMVSGHQAESRKALGEALELAGRDPVLRMAALNALGYSWAQSDDDLARRYVEEALQIARDIGDRHREAALWNHLADLHHRAGRTEEAEKCLTEAVKLFVEVEPGAWEPEVWLLTRW